MGMQACGHRRTVREYGTKAFITSGRQGAL